MDFWTPQNFARVTRGRWLSAVADPTAPLRGISTDSRHAAPGQVFLALRGERFDGHDFLVPVARAGAGLLVVSAEAKARGVTGAGVLLVDDTLAALQSLAAAHRDVLAEAGCKVIAVAGSNGKTTTRNLIHAVLSAAFRGTQSPKSFNNHIGVPLTLLAANPAARERFVVVEVGTNHPGEIDALARIVRPDAAVVTSIGHEHMEFFKTLDGVAKEEAAILRHIKPGGVTFLESRVMGRFQPMGLIPAGLTVVVYGSQQSENTISYHDAPTPVTEPSENIGQRFTTFGGKLRITLPLVGEHNADNALAAVAVGRWMGVENDAIAAALADVRPVEMRLNVLRLGTPAKPIVVLNDAYNANPDSMERAISTLRNFPLPAPDGRRVMVLGDMLELGEGGPDLHRSIGRAILKESAGHGGEAKLHAAILVGRLAMFVAEALARSWSQGRIHAFPAWDDTVPAKVAALLQPGDAVLIKASRGIGLERLLPAIQKKFAG